MIKKQKESIKLSSIETSFVLIHTPVAAGKSTAIRVNENIHYNIICKDDATLCLRYIHDYDYSHEYVALTSRDQRIYASIFSLIIGLGRVLSRYIIEGERSNQFQLKKAEFEIMTHLRDVHFQNFFCDLKLTFSDEVLNWVVHSLRQIPTIKTFIPRGYRYPRQFTEHDRQAVLDRGMSVDEVITRLKIYESFDKHELFERGTILDWLREDLPVLGNSRERGWHYD